MNREIHLTPPCDNVFARLGVEQPEEQALKTDLAVAFMQALDELAITPTDAARTLGVPPQRIDRLVGGYLDEFSSAAITGYLARLGFTVRLDAAPRPAIAD